MKKSTLAGGAAVLAVLWILVPPQTASGEGPQNPQSEIKIPLKDDVGTPPPEYVEGEVVAKLKSGASPAEFTGGGAVLAVTRALSHSSTYLLELVPGADTDSAAAELDASGSVEYAHPNYLLNRVHPVQGSYPFPDLNDVGEYEGQQAALSLQLTSAHSQATGSGVRVGILDVGIDFQHALLSSVATSGHDFVDGDENAFDEPGGLNSGHGTFVAGLVHLAAPDAQLSAYRIADADGYGDGFTLAQAIERAVDDGCDIINLSVVLLKRHLAVRDAILYAEANGVLVVAAAGNQSKAAAVYPAAEAGAMAVGALDALLVRAPFSTYGSHLSVCAPGIELYSSFQNDHYAWWDGSSFSAPLVAGAAALLAEVAPGTSGAAWRHALEVTSSDISAQNPGMTGLLGHGQIDPVAALAFAASPEWATVTPDTLYFTHQVGRLYLLAPFAYAAVQSSNAPAMYFAEVSGPDSIFSWVADSVGTTDDSLMVRINPIEAPGVYINTVQIYVEGVAEPARLTVHLEVEEPDSNSQSAWAEPNTLYFQAQAGVEVLLAQNIVIQSSPSGAAYSGTVLSGGGGLTSLPDPSGITPDSVTIVVEPARAFSAGMYEDTVSFEVQGVPYPIPVFVMVYIMDSTITPPPPTKLVLDTVAAYPGGQAEVCLRTAAAEGSWGGFDFTVSYPPGLLSLLGASPGEFVSICDWEHFTYSTPGTGLVRLVGVAEIAAVPGNPACMDPSFGAELACMSFQVVDDSAPGCQVAPIRFWWTTCGDNAISNEVGTTITIVSGLPGSVLDYNGTDLTGTANLGGPPQPCPDGPSILTLAQFQNGAVYVACDSIPQPGDTAWAQPATMIFTSFEGFVPTVMLSGWAHVFSTNAPSMYVAGVSGPDPIFVTLLDSLGQTNDSMEILVNPAGMPAGSYLNTVRFYVNGIANPALVNVYLQVLADSTGGGTDSAVVVPSTLYVQAPAGSTTEIERWVMLYSSNAPALYFGYVLGWPSFVVLPDSVGYTNDSVRIVIHPDGLPPGIHRDTVQFDVQGTSAPVQLSVELEVSGSDSLAVAGSVYNYPNPFNPETQIAFTLSSGSRVTLRVYNILGEHVVTLVDRNLPAGSQRFTWDGRTQDGDRASSGVYFYRLSVDEEVHTGKMMMLR